MNTRTLSNTPAAQRARARRAAKVAPAAVAAPAPAAFTSMTLALGADDAVNEAETAEAAAIEAIAKARAPKAKPKAAPAVDTRVFAVGTYKGRAGAMFDFMNRVATLGATFGREVVVASVVAKPPHALVSNRAQALDYFAWAYRKGLLVIAPTPVVKARAPRKAKGSKAGKALPSLLSQG